MASPDDYEEITGDFVAMTGATPDDAQRYLTASNWDMTPAVQAYFADEDERRDNPAAAADSEAAPADYTGPRTLDGRPAPQAIPTTSSSSSSRKPQPKKKGLATLSSLGGGGAHDHDDDDDSDMDGDDQHRDTYAGGEKSGLAVQDPSQRSSDPKRLINDILAKAKGNARRPEAEASSAAGPSSSASFRGSGQTLGGEGAESRVIPDPEALPDAPSQPSRAEVQERVLHIWQDGFSIDDGPLHAFSDPANAADLRMIQQGRAPVHLMNVRYDEPIDVKVQQHAEDWRQLPKIYKPFGGEGRRLGSPVPGDGSASISAPTLPISATAPAAPSTSGAPSAAAADESQPTIMIRVQLLDGSRLPARFNTSQTVGDMYDFVSRASPGIGADGWVLATTFPNKEHTDKSLVLGDMAEFKRGGTVVVKKV